ncbi:MAG: HAMP domain-containing sensor histidine kinase, partial [Bacteroidales bacterium]|nr:HAMP domain-containing sensor histidine kinase [Bacteroidales bacterium]
AGKLVENNKFIEIFVKDTGIGIPEEKIDKLFRIEENYTTYGTNNEKGTGLGLILCKELVEKNHGEIWVDSTAGKETIFGFSLPVET